MPKKDLKNKPLAEAILEFKWGPPATLAAAPIQPLSTLPDSYYRLILGRFSERIQQDYPVYEQLPSAQLPDSLAVQQVQHRFRTTQGGWPLVQLGPGIMTVNETKNYTWKDFNERCKNAVDRLVASHPAKEQFEPNELILRYIDAVEVDFSEESVFAFLKNKLKIAISLPADLFSGAVTENPTEFNFQATFPCDEPPSSVTLRLASGRLNLKAAFIWEILVHTKSDQFSSKPQAFSDWLEKAHDLIERWFFKLIEGELEARFE